MSAEAFLRGIATDSYENKVKASANSFNVIKAYLSTKEKPGVAYELTMYMCLSMFASDYALSKKEFKFFNEFVGIKYNLDDLTNDFKKFKADNYKRVFDYLKLAPIDVRKHSAILAACCLSCDREVTASETEDFKKLLVLLGLSV